MIDYPCDERFQDDLIETTKQGISTWIIIEVDGYLNFNLTGCEIKSVVLITYDKIIRKSNVRIVSFS